MFIFGFPTSPICLSPTVSSSEPSCLHIIQLVNALELSNHLSLLKLKSIFASDINKFNGNFENNGFLTFSIEIHSVLRSNSYRLCFLNVCENSWFPLVFLIQLNSTQLNRVLLEVFYRLAVIVSCACAIFSLAFSFCLQISCTLPAFFVIKCTEC